MRALCGCTQLTSLELYGVDVVCSDLSAVLLCMSQLASLMLCELHQLESLGFLSAGRLGQTLTELKLWNCADSSQRPYQWADLHPLRQLRELTLMRAPMETLDAATLAQYQPPSALLPALVEFRYYG